MTPDGRKQLRRAITACLKVANEATHSGIEVGALRSANIIGWILRHNQPVSRVPTVLPLEQETKRGR